MKRKHPSIAIKGYSIMLTEQQALGSQYTCQEDISKGLALLTTLVQAADIPEAERLELLSTIVHVCHHIRGETLELKRDIEGRAN